MQLRRATGHIQGLGVVAKATRVRRQRLPQIAQQGSQRLANHLGDAWIGKVGQAVVVLELLGGNQADADVLGDGLGDVQPATRNRARKLHQHLPGPLGMGRQRTDMGRAVPEINHPQRQLFLRRLTGPALHPQRRRRQRRRTTQLRVQPKRRHRHNARLDRTLLGTGRQPQRRRRAGWHFREQLIHHLPFEIIHQLARQLERQRLRDLLRVRQRHLDQTQRQIIGDAYRAALGADLLPSQNGKQRPHLPIEQRIHQGIDHRRLLGLVRLGVHRAFVLATRRRQRMAFARLRNALFLDAGKVNGAEALLDASDLHRITAQVYA
jgi:hypothetical protein